MAGSSPAASPMRSGLMRRYGGLILVKATRRSCAMPDALLEINGIETRYGPSHVLFGVSLAIGRGEVVTLMGRNGMGKTTTVRSIMGLTPPRSGSIRFDGGEMRGLPPYRIAQRGIGLVPE